jgi:hypothetical protein
LKAESQFMLSPYLNITAVTAADPALADTVSDWQAIRHAIDVEDTLLGERTFKWLASLPKGVRPMETARQYARIVNRISDLWAHCEFTRLYFQSLLIDRRGGRTGFPAAIKQELVALQQYYFEHLSGLPAVLWNAVPLAEPRIPDKVFAPISQKTEIEIRPLQAGLVGARGHKPRDEGSLRLAPPLTQRGVWVSPCR